MPNGKVMAAMGCGRTHCWQLFDPVLGHWTPMDVLGDPNPGTASNGFARLIGLGSGHALAMFDSSTGRKFRYNGKAWVPLPAPSTLEYGRYHSATATLLNPPPCRQPERLVGYENYPCGGVLIAGGGSSNDPDPPMVSYTADLFTYDRENDDPGHRGTVLALEPMPKEVQDRQHGHRDGFTILLDDGRVLVAGGHLKGGTHALFFNPGAGSVDPVHGHLRGHWSRAEPLLHQVWSSTFTTGRATEVWTLRLPGAERYMVGGGSLYPLIFDPNEGALDSATGKRLGSWKRVGKQSCNCLGGVLQADGTIFAIKTSQPVTEAEKAFVLDPSADPDPTQWDWKEVAPPLDAPGTQLLSAVVLDGAGTPEQCGASCGLVLTSGHVAGAGLAMLFGKVLAVTGLEPTNGPACGGRPVTISGRGLERVTSVSFGTERVEAITRNRDGSITVTSPRHMPAAVPVTVSTASGAVTTKASANAIFTYTPVEPPRVMGLSTREGRADRRTPVTIIGTFPVECVRKVTFGGNEATFAPPAPTAIKATSPTGTPGTTVPVEVLFDPGPPTAADSPVAGVAVPPNGGVNLFSYRALPAITGMPGVSALGGPVGIAGLNFEPDDDDPSLPKVYFDGVARSAARATATRVDVTAPPLAAGRLPGPGALVAVETAKRGRSEPAPFAYHPGVRGIFPASGFTTGGESRTITGVGLRTADKVLIGGEEATILDRPTDQDALVVRTPPRSAPESVRVEVIVAGLGSLEPIFFTYGDPPPTPDDPGKRDTGVTSGPKDPVVQVAPPGGTGAPAPGASPTASPSPTPSPTPSPSASPGGSAAPSASASGSPSSSGALGQATSANQAPAATQTPVSAGAAGTAPAPASGPAAAPAQATPGSGGSLGSGQAGVGGDEERGEGRYTPRHNMTAADVGLGLGAAGAAVCFSALALARRRRSARSRPRPRGAY